MVWWFLSFSDVLVAKKEAKSLLCFGGSYAFLMFQWRKKEAKSLLWFDGICSLLKCKSQKNGAEMLLWFCVFHVYS
jgi:hypothetical protein